MTSFTLFCTFQVSGIHCWPGAPEMFALLRHPHRHVFHVRVELEVKGDNRTLEFVTLKEIARNEFIKLRMTDPVKDEWKFMGWNFGSQSCEMLAEKLGMRLRTVSWPVTLVEVSEDGENGAQCRW